MATTFPSSSLLVTRPTLANSVSRPMNDKLYDFVHVRDFGATGDGVTDDTAAIQAALDSAHTTGTTVVFDSGATYLISSSIHARRQIIMGPSTTFKATETIDTPATVNFYIERPVPIQGCTFNYVNLVVTSSDTARGVAERMQILGTRFQDCNLVIGSSTATSRGFDISRCEFRNALSRGVPAIQIYNASDVRIENNAVQEYQMLVQISPTRSFACHNITIEGNTSSNSARIVLASGTSMNRISNLTIRRNTFTSTTRDTFSSSNGCITGLYCTNLVIEDNVLASINDVIKIQACLGVTIRGNRIVRADLQQGIRISGCRNVKIIANSFMASGASGTSDILVLGPNQNSIISNNPYSTRNVIISENDFSTIDRSVKSDIASFVHVTNNTFTSKSAIGSTAAMVWFTANSQNCSCWGNRYYGPTSATAPVKIDSGATVITDTTATANVVVTPAAPVVTSIFTGTDSTLNNSTAYIYKFTVGDVRQITAVVDSNASSVPTRMTGISGAQIAFNASAWDTVTSKLPDLVANGQVFDYYGTENFWWAKSGGMIDTEGVLTCRDFFCTGNGNSTSYSNSANATIISDIGARQVAESGWHSAYFRTPLVVDGAVYDPSVTGIYSTSSFTTATDPRIAIGQDAAGAFYVIAVDGRFGDSVGCTLQQLAQKFVSLGCINAFNLDGGGSATLWVNGSVVNRPSDGSPRPIYSMWYV